MTGTERTLTRSARTKAPGRKEAQSLEEHFSPESLAQRLECSVAKVRKSIWQGQLDAVRVGRLVRIPTSSVQKWLLATRPARPEAHS
jgi:excisionase family DNA binding protein